MVWDVELRKYDDAEYFDLFFREKKRRRVIKIDKSVFDSHYMLEAKVRENWTVTE